MRRKLIFHRAKRSNACNWSAKAPRRLPGRCLAVGWATSYMLDLVKRPFKRSRLRFLIELNDPELHFSTRRCTVRLVGEQSSALLFDYK